MQKRLRSVFAVWPFSLFPCKVLQRMRRWGLICDLIPSSCGCVLLIPRVVFNNTGSFFSDELESEPVDEESPAVAERRKRGGMTAAGSSTVPGMFCSSTSLQPCPHSNGFPSLHCLFFRHSFAVVCCCPATRGTALLGLPFHRALCTREEGRTSA